MAKAGYVVATTGAVSLAVSTTKTVLALKANAAFGLDLKKLRVSFGGTSGAPAQVGLWYCTFATAGTSGGTPTIAQVYGRTVTHGVTAGQDYSSAPTVLSQIETHGITPNGGVLWYDIPLGDTPDCAPNEGWLLQMNSPVVVNVWASMWFERC